MRAWGYKRYGDADRLRLEDRSEAPLGPHDIRIRVEACGLNGSDAEFLRGRPSYARLYGALRPRIGVLGSDVTGRVIEVGEKVTSFSPGHSVIGDVFGSFGGLAETCVAPARKFVARPGGLDAVAAACIGQGTTIATQGLAHLPQDAAGLRVLINGAGGGSGIFAVQLAAARGAHVTAVDRGGKMDALRDAGAHVALDFEQTDFAATGQSWHLILDLWATRPARALWPSLAPGGTYIAVGGPTGVILGLLAGGRFGHEVQGKRIKILAMEQTQDDLRAAARFMQDGTLRPIVDQVFGFEDVPAAMARQLSGLAAGKVIVRMP